MTNLNWPPLVAVEPSEVPVGAKLYGDGNLAGRPWRLFTTPTTVTRVNTLGHATRLDGVEVDGATGFTLITSGSLALIERS